MQSFHDRLKAEQDILETYDVEESCKYITVSSCCGPVHGGTFLVVGLPKNVCLILLNVSVLCTCTTGTYASAGCALKQ